MSRVELGNGASDDLGDDDADGQGDGGGGDRRGVITRPEQQRGEIGHDGDGRDVERRERRLGHPHPHEDDDEAGAVRIAGGHAEVGRHGDQGQGEGDQQQAGPLRPAIPRCDEGEQGHEHVGQGDEVGGDAGVGRPGTRFAMNEKSPPRAKNTATWRTPRCPSLTDESIARSIGSAGPDLDLLGPVPARLA